MLIHTIRDTLSPTPDTRKRAEATLAAEEPRPQFSINLLHLVQGDAAAVAAGLDNAVRFAAVVYFKNFVKKYWKMDTTDPSKISLDDRKLIKASLVQLMMVTPHTIQVQLSEAIAIIADSDFPNDWPLLIDELVSKLNPNDYAPCLGILQTAHSILKRWRHQVRSDEFFTEINFVLSRFAAPFLGFLQATDKLIDASANDLPSLEILFNGLHLLTKIFFSLNSPDLPEFFEDNQDAFFGIFMKYLNYSNPLLARKATEDEPGPIDRVKATICTILDLYGSKYEEDFKSLPQFVEAAWGLLTTTSHQRACDELVSSCMAFLTAVVRPARHKAMFEREDVLRSICEKIVIPNMTLRESDEELFNEDSIEFIRRDLEGSDVGTRRGASTDLIRGLLEHFAEQVTSIISGYLSVYLSEYEKDKKANWKAKDTALYLIMAVSAKAYSLQAGVTETNKYIETVPVFVANVLPDLQAPVDGVIEPMIKVAALKYLLIFRNQLTKAQLMGVLPLVVQHIASSNYVVYTYASVCLERILAMRAVSFTKDDVQGFAQNVLHLLFQKIYENGSTADKVSENDYLIKAIVRILAISQDSAVPYAVEVVTKLTQLLELIHKNPSNPKFNHFVFEGIGTIIRNGKAHPQLVAQFESMLFPVFQAILSMDITEFMPYVFQLLSQLLVYHNEAGIPAAYQAMLPPLLQPIVWESHGNIPALVNLLDSYLVKGPQEIIANNQLTPILGIYQKLIASRMNDHHGFELLTAVLDNVPLANVSSYMKNIFLLQLNRLKASRTPKLTMSFIRFLCYYFVLRKPGFSADEIIGIIDSIQPLLFKSLLESVILPALSEFVSAEDKRIVIVGFVTMLTSSQALLTDAYLPVWGPVLITVSSLLQQPQSGKDSSKPSSIAAAAAAAAAAANNSSSKSSLTVSSITAAAAEDYLLDAEEAGYQVAYSRLTTLDKKKKDPLAGVQDVGATAVQVLAQFKAASPAVMARFSRDVVTLFP